MKNTKLTSVKILENLYERFKLNTVNTKMTLQKLTNRSVDRFLTDVNFVFFIIFLHRIYIYKYINI